MRKRKWTKAACIEEQACPQKTCFCDGEHCALHCTICALFSQWKQKVIVIEGQKHNKLYGLLLKKEETGWRNKENFSNICTSSKLLNI